MSVIIKALNIIECSTSLLVVDYKLIKLQPTDMQRDTHTEIQRTW